MNLTKTGRVYDCRQKSFFYVKLTKFADRLFYVWLENNSLVLLLRIKWSANHETIRHRLKGLLVIKQIASVKTKLVNRMALFVFGYT